MFPTATRARSRQHASPGVCAFSQKWWAREAYLVKYLVRVRVG